MQSAATPGLEHIAPQKVSPAKLCELETKTTTGQTNSYSDVEYTNLFKTCSKEFENYENS